MQEARITPFETDSEDADEQALTHRQGMFQFSQKMTLFHMVAAFLKIYDMILSGNQEDCHDALNMEATEAIAHEVKQGLHS
jgi:hypothetical protein